MVLAGRYICLRMTPGRNLALLQEARKVLIRYHSISALQALIRLAERVSYRPSVALHPRTPEGLEDGASGFKRNRLPRHRTSKLPVSFLLPDWAPFNRWIDGFSLPRCFLNGKVRCERAFQIAPTTTGALETCCRLSCAFSTSFDTHFHSSLPSIARTPPLAVLIKQAPVAQASRLGDLLCAAFIAIKTPMPLKLPSVQLAPGDPVQKACSIFSEQWDA